MKLGKLDLVAVATLAILLTLLFVFVPKAALGVSITLGGVVVVAATSHKLFKN